VSQANKSCRLSASTTHHDSAFGRGNEEDLKSDISDDGLSKNYRKLPALGGLKKRSTDEAKLDHVKQLVLTKNIAMMKFVYLDNEKVEKGKKHQMRKGEYTKILDNVMVLFRVDHDDFNVIAIRRRMCDRQTLRVSHQGPMSPMEDIEAHIADVVLQLETMKEPLSASEGLRLAN
jgi:hypothetical protein